MRLFGRGGKKTVAGEIGGRGLSRWWLETFTAEEREYMTRLYQPMGLSNSRSLTEGEFLGIGRSTSGFLSTLAGWFNKPKDRRLAVRLLEKAQQVGDGDVLDQHFLEQHLIQTYYPERDKDPSALGNAIAACERQIALAPKAAREFIRQFPARPDQPRLPRHVGFEQLAIIREKQGDFAGAIRLAEEARKQGWNGDWDKRIARCRAKASK